jgi:hypothetical protein
LGIAAARRLYSETLSMRKADPQLGLEVRYMLLYVCIVYCLLCYMLLYAIICYDMCVLCIVYIVLCLYSETLSMRKADPQLGLEVCIICVCLCVLYVFGPICYYMCVLCMRPGGFTVKRLVCVRQTRNWAWR